MSYQPHRSASDDYQNRVDAHLNKLGLACFTHAESKIVDTWSCMDFLAESCADYLAEQRAKPNPT